MKIWWTLKIILFYKILEFKNINLYWYGQQQFMVHLGHIFTLQVWVKFNFFFNRLKPMVNDCVTNENQGY
jgi:hypothetical protein